MKSASVIGSDTRATRVSLAANTFVIIVMRVEYPINQTSHQEIRYVHDHVVPRTLVHPGAT